VLRENENDELPEWTEPIHDSKRHTKSGIRRYSEMIRELAPGYGLGWVYIDELNQIGIAQALRLATVRAVIEIIRKGVKFDEIVIDGPENFLEGTKLEELVTNINKADDLVKEVSAASIVAKDARDNYMIDIAQYYPEYLFENNVGYGTPQHIEAIRRYGITPEHRLFIKTIYKDLLNGKLRGKYFNDDIEHMISSGFAGKQEDVQKKLKAQKTTTKVGSYAEHVIANFLEDAGHTIVARNHKTRFYEIDIVSVLDGHAYFTEVKYRKDTSHGTAAEMVNVEKLKQMRFAAEAYMRYNPILRGLDFSLAVGTVEGEKFDKINWFVLDE